MLPPRIAPYQVVIVPIPRGNWKETVLPKAQRDPASSSRPRGVRVMLDDRDAYTPGWKFAEWELRGVPLRLEIGPKDIEKSAVLFARRDTREKLFVPMDGLVGSDPRAARRDPAQRCSSARAQFREEHTSAADNYDEFKADDGRAPRIRDRALVRQRRLRSADQDRHAGDDPQHADRGRRAVRDVRALRSIPARAEAWFAKALRARRTVSKPVGRSPERGPLMQVWWIADVLRPP